MLEYDMPKFGTPGWDRWAQISLNRSTNYQEHLEDLEHDRACHNG